MIELEIPIIKHFKKQNNTNKSKNKNKVTLEKMNTFSGKQFGKITLEFNFEEIKETDGDK